MKLDLQIIFSGIGLGLFIPFLIEFTYWEMEIIIPIMIIQVICIVFAVRFYHGMYDTRKRIILYE